MTTQTQDTLLALEKFIASVIRNQYRKFGMYKWDSSNIPSRQILLTEKQTALYDKLFRNRVFKLEKSENWTDGTFTLSKDGNGLPCLMHKSGMAFYFTTSVHGKSFAMADQRKGKTIWMKNMNQSWLIIKLYKKQFV